MAVENNNLDLGGKSAFEGKSLFKRFLVRTAIISFVIILITLSLGTAPLAVREMANSFFSLFIHDERVESLSDSKLDSKGFEEPTRITIASIGLDAKVLNPKNTDAKTLDEALLYGAVRYPGSGDLLSNNNMFLFGHSSYLPVVHNQAFKTFDGIQKLKVGESVFLYGTGKKYEYKVSEVKQVKAEDALVDLSSSNHKLILSTCDSFGKKNDRFIVIADFVESSVLENASSTPNSL